MDASGQPAPAGSPVVRPLWSFVGPAFGAMVAAGMLAAPIGPLGAAIRNDLGLSTAAMTVTVVVPYVVVAVLLVPGYLLGRRWPTATGVPALVFLLLGSVVCAFAPGAVLMGAGLVVVGLGAGTAIGVAVALSGQLGRRRSGARLVLGLALGTALLLAPVVSGVLAQRLGWRPAFLFGVPVVVLAVVGTGATGIAMWVARGSRSGRPAVSAPATPLAEGARPGGPAR
ncbi:MFS transporter [Micromonospora sp. NPDC049048]|uniref:MFS transporter n=1 Tax=Micromonospora sp. NPDC049048 TaxID=3364263 RepID=UPI003714B284